MPATQCETPAYGCSCEWLLLFVSLESAPQPDNVEGKHPVFNPALRILDANLNRAREGLRVLEDYARFILNDDSISAHLKRIRHDLAACAPQLASEAILHRDTPGDVGTENKTSAEAHRADLAH